MSLLLRTIKPIASLLPVLLMLFGCSDGSTAPPPTEKGWKRYDVPRAGFSIAVPEGWTSVSNYDQDFSDIIAHVKEKLGVDADMVEETVHSASIEGNEFSALDLEPETISYSYIPSVSVRRSEGNTSVIEAQLAADIKAINAIYKEDLVSKIDAKIIEFPGALGYTEKFTVRENLGDGSFGRYVVQRIFKAYDIGNSRKYDYKGAFMLTMTVGVSQEQSYADTFQKISNSLGTIETRK